MVTAVPLEADTITALDAMVARGRFPSRDVAIRTALHIVEEVDAADETPLTSAEIAALERALSDVAAGRVLSAEEVRAELERRHTARL